MDLECGEVLEDVVPPEARMAMRLASDYVEKTPHGFSRTEIECGEVHTPSGKRFMSERHRIPPFTVETHAAAYRAKSLVVLEDVGQSTLRSLREKEAVFTDRIMRLLERRGENAVSLHYIEMSLIDLAVDLMEARSLIGYLESCFRDSRLFHDREIRGLHDPEKARAPLVQVHKRLLDARSELVSAAEAMLYPSPENASRLADSIQPLYCAQSVFEAAIRAVVDPEDDEGDFEHV